ncbi:MAG: class I SAM-dependent methyltransferase [Xanthomonadales bacterium]|nr:class I SAM-dependent methyltransferase [Xanthomonadales bacterium]
MSSLFGGLQQVFPSIIGSEYLGEDKVPGATYNWQGFEVRHESITEMSFQPESLDFIAHLDVLEHVYDYRRALKQAASVLKPEGGTMLCTVPFFMTRVDALELARPHADGSIEYFVAPEYHGDGLRPEGILTWHHFGWELLQDAIDAGFSSASIGIDYDPFCGFTTNNHPSADYGLMYPLVFRAQR